MLANYTEINNFTTQGVGKPIWDYTLQAPNWEYLDDIIGGTNQIQLKAQQYLPKEPFEHQDTYLQRLQRSVLVPYLNKILSVIVSTICSNQPSLDQLTDLFLEHSYNLDGNNTNLDDFSRDLINRAVLYGHSLVLVDLPQYGSNAGIRPYWKIYSPKDIIGWRISSNLAEPELTQIRLRDWVTVPYGRYDTRVIQRIKVFEPGRYAIFQETLKQESTIQESLENSHFFGSETTYELLEEGDHPLDYIPVSLLYTNKIDELISKSPLLEIADLNIAHYRLLSDYHWILHVGAVPQLVLKGVQKIKPSERQAPPDLENYSNLTPEQKELARLRQQLRLKQESENIALGPNEALLLPENGEAYYLEPDGKCFTALSNEIDRLESRIVELGATVLTKQKNSAETAESKRLDRLQSDNTLVNYCHRLEAALNQAFKIHSDYYSAEPPVISIAADFENKLLDPATIKQTLDLWLNGAITQETLLQILQRGELFDGIKNFDIQQQINNANNSDQTQINP